MVENSTGDFVEVVYATADEQTIVCVRWQAGITAAQAVERSGLTERIPSTVARPPVLGLFGARVDPGHQLQPGDRVEICRPLRADPRAARRALAARGLVIGDIGVVRARDPGED